MLITKKKGLGYYIRKHRRNANMTQERIAELVGVTPKYIQYLESSKRTPSIKTLNKIAKVLKLNVRELFPK